MFRLTVVYPSKAQSTFDFDYYIDQHLPLIDNLYKPFGLSHWQVDKGVSLSSQQQPQFVVACHMYFKTLDGIKQALKANGQVVMADISQFTNIKPDVTFSEMVRVSGG